MTVFNARFVLRAALIGAMALGLAACGRKGPLDLPPSAAAEAAPAPQQQANPMSMSPLGGGGNNQGSGGDMLETPKGEKKRIFLDNLLN